MPHFSRRIHWHLQPNNLSILTEQKRSASVGFLDLTQSNPTDAGFEYPAEEIAAALADPRGLRYEPTPNGSPEARAAVAEYYRGRVSPDRLLLTASTSEAYSYLFKLLCDPGDQVLVPRPSYPLFEFLASLENVDIVQYPLFYQHGWGIDLEMLQTLTTDRTRAIVLVNPNNPTGSYLKEDEYAALVDVCRIHGLALVADEVFADYAFGPDEHRVSTLAGRDDVLAFSLSGLSKVSALPQMKLGWIAVSGPAREADEALLRLELIADTFLSVGTPVQCAAPALLKVAQAVQPQILGRARHNLEFLRRATQETALRVLELEGGWYATVQMPRIRSEEDWALELLRHYDVLVQPGFFYDFDAEPFLVLSLLTREGIFEEGVKRLLTFTWMYTSTEPC